MLLWTWIGYLSMIVGAVATGRWEVQSLAYGAFSWTGGALFTLLIVLYHDRPPSRNRQTDGAQNTDSVSSNLTGGT